MKNKNKIEEMKMDVDTYNKIKGKLTPDDKKELTLTDKDDSSSLFETDAVIEPQDKATIKYLSNVRDKNTSEVSQPFTIVNKNYQMIRGVHPTDGIVMAVYCLDDIDDEGNNIIHTIEEFEQNIALPMKERLEKTVTNDDTYRGYNHFFVNKKTNEIKKFRNIDEMLSCGKSEDEEYMPTSRFKKYMTEKLFGKRNRLTELDVEPVTGEEEDLSVKAKKMMSIIDSNQKLKTAIESIKSNPKAQAEVIASFAELIGVPRTGLSNLVNQIKDTSKLNENRNVIKTIKVKDIK